MLTEKAIADTSWCPMLWREKQNTSKRVKPGRDWDPMEMIQKALITGIQNKSALIKESGFKRIAQPYGQEFWIHVPTLDSPLLVTAKELELEPFFGGDQTVTLIREPKYDPRTDENKTSENHLHQLILKHIQHWFNVPNHKVVTNYPTAQSITTEELDEDKLGEAQAWAAEMQGMYEGSVALSPRLDRCFNCWWKECPARSNKPQPPAIALPKGRSHGTGIMD